ncbi:unnamed protein product [Linum tenue]|uniref:Neurochondrin n=1 Tax=Linum tenue TaxID=586396 RepID=A0AAV0K438_9ROSI|nr:unnamed protein product [Linum tenue]
MWLTNLCVGKVTSQKHPMHQVTKSENFWSTCCQLKVKMKQGFVFVIWVLQDIPFLFHMLLTSNAVPNDNGDSRVQNFDFIQRSQGCKLVAFKVVEFLVKLLCNPVTEDMDRIFLACDTIMNLLLKQEEVHFQMEESSCISLLNALAFWAEKSDDPSVLMMAASICALGLDFTSEAALLKHPNFDSRSLTRLCHLISRSFAFATQGMADAVRSETDLIEIITSGFSRWADRFPSIKAAVLGV